MPKPAWDDLDAFLRDDEFATVATVRLQDGGTRTVRGIFDDPYLNAQLGEYEIDTTRPRLLCKEADVIGVKRGDLVDIDGRVYDVMTGAQPDGTGMALLEMAAQGR
ncbi:head-tail joining protein [Microvirga alba]|uniref:Uncharacterized protein n=1 Tax=Microvirga alba TaxID=2791025 RepID=A0A931BTS9_9HYPH|nr:hypothetical protein [Microvirga alba]MBF9235584.1 hypothetical protein [Microvirga alba]